MKETFDIRRFGKYLAFDLNNAWERFGFSLLLLGFLPVLFYALFALLHLLLHSPIPDDPDTYRVLTAVIIFVASVSFAPKVWGSVTSRKGGSDWISIPASALEKTLSIIVLTFFVLPICLGALLFISNGIVGMIVPGMEAVLSPEGIFSGIVVDEDEMISLNPGLLLWADWCQWILFFTLGALIFKKNKVGKSLLCLMGIGIILSTLSVLILKAFGIAPLEQFADDFTVSKLVDFANFGLNLYLILVTAILAVCIYFRVKTIKA